MVEAQLSGYAESASPSWLRRNWRALAVFIWLAFSLALAAWWMIFGLHLIDRLSQINSEQALELQRQHRMLLSEGVFLFLLLLGGGASLLYYIIRESRRQRQVREFFATFTHEIKTALASLRVQAETLGEDLAGSGQSAVAGRLLKDARRLELQVENSIYLASDDGREMTLRLLRERVALRDLVNQLRLDYPDLSLVLEGDAHVVADSGAIRVVFRNLLANSVVHGLASSVKIIPQQGASSGRVLVSVSDNGRGFSGQIDNLGELFGRINGRSGTGLGLYIVRQMMKRMGGRAQFEFDQASGLFQVLLEFEGEVDS